MTDTCPSHLFGLWLGVLALISSLWALPADAAESSRYQPALGKGVNYAENKTFRRCVTIPESKISNSGGFAGRLYKETAIANRKELHNALDISAAISAKILWSKINASSDYFKDVAITDDSFFWLVDARFELSDEQIDTGSPELQLTAEAKEILASENGLGKFYEACGEYFYSGRSLGAQYSLLYKFSSHNLKTIERIKTEASFSGWGVNARGSFKRLAQGAEEASMLNVYASSYGGGAELSSYAKDPEQLESTLAALRDSLAQKGQGVPLRWFLSDYELFPEVLEAKFL